MPIKTLDAQRRGRQIGEIRIGMQVPTSSGKMRPSKLDSFRLTTKSAQIAEATARLLGGEVRPVDLAGQSSYEVVTHATELAVMVPPGEAVISQWFELWSGAGCQRRCDGETEQLTQTPCKCPSDPEQRNALAATGGACKPTTRLNVMLPDLPDLGVWLLTSHGYYAGLELGGAAELLGQAREAGVIIPAVLRLEQRQVKRGGQTRKFAVPVLEIGATLRQLVELGGNGGIASALPPAPVSALPTAPPAKAIEAYVTAAPEHYDRIAELHNVYRMFSPANVDDFKAWWKIKGYPIGTTWPQATWELASKEQLDAALGYADDLLSAAITADYDDDDPARPF